MHDEFKTRSLGELIEKHPDAGVLVHPESPEEIVAMADVVGWVTKTILSTRAART